MIALIALGFSPIIRNMLLGWHCKPLRQSARRRCNNQRVGFGFYRDAFRKEQYRLARREARASEARSGTMRGDCETATTKRMFVMAFSDKVEFGAAGKCSVWVWVFCVYSDHRPAPTLTEYALVGVVTAQYLHWSLQQNRKIKPETPIVDIPKIVFDASFD